MTDLDVVNKALAKLLAGRAASMADTGTSQAKVIAEYADARDEVLRMFNWPCAIARKALVAPADAAWVKNTAYAVGDLITNVSNLYRCITAGTSENADAAGPKTLVADITDGTAHWEYLCAVPDNETLFAYQYIHPSDCLKILRIGSGLETSERGPGAQYLLEGQFVYTDSEEAKLKYIARVTNPSLWDSLLVRAVVLYLANLTGPDVTGNKTDITDRVAKEMGQIMGLAKGIAIHEGAEAPAEVVLWSEV